MVIGNYLTTVFILYGKLLDDDLTCLKKYSKPPTYKPSSCKL